MTLKKQWNKVNAILSDPLISRLEFIDPIKFAASLASVKNGSASADVVRLLRCLALEVWLREAVARGILSLPASVLTKDAPETFRMGTHAVT
jgi:hypothetical protein